MSKRKIEVKDIENTVFSFNGMRLDAVKSSNPKECEGCALINKNCSKSDVILSVCREGYIFKEHKNKKK